MNEEDNRTDQENIKTFNITSTLAEKGIDLVKDFLGKLITPAIEEVGLLVKDKIAFFRWKNQVDILITAKKYTEKHNIDPKTISLKLLVPLLDYAGLEESEYLKDKWALLLTNLVDSRQNITNQVFPYLLGQISIEEYRFLEQALVQRDNEMEELKNEMNLLRAKNQTRLKKLKAQLKEAKAQSNKTAKSHTKGLDLESLKKADGIIQIQFNINQIENDKGIRALHMKMSNTLKISVKDLEEYELANILRLGIIKAIQIPYSYGNEVRIPREGEYLSFDIHIENDLIEYSFTELGEKFIYACTEKKLE